MQTKKIILTFLLLCSALAFASNTASKQFTLTVAPPPLQITTLPTLVAGQQGSAYTVTLAASGGTSPYTWSVASSSILPAGLTLSSAGTLSGMPTTHGTYTFSITATDSTNATATVAFTLTTSTAPTLQIITVSVTAAQLGVPYSLQLSASGGVTPYTWSLAAGSTLPTGLTLSPAGVISGTPTTSGSFTFTATVTDLAGN